MAKLSQIVALEKGQKERTHRLLTDLYQQVQKPDLLSGLTRTYRPLKEGDPGLPPETKQVQVRADDLFARLEESLVRLFDIVATKEYANTRATADLVVGEVTLARDVPATTLLFLEKQLTDIHTFVSKFPTLDPAERWHYDTNAGVWASEPLQTARTKRVLRNHEKAPATKEHPAQVEVYSEDEVIGYYAATKYSGALEGSRMRTLVRRVEALQEAVKVARDRANECLVDDVTIGKAVLDYLLAP